MNVFCVIKAGYDYPHPEVIGICATMDQAQGIVDGLAADASTFPWNGRAIIEIDVEAGTVITWDELLEAAVPVRGHLHSPRVKP